MNLVRLGFSARILEIHEFGHGRMHEDIMASADTSARKTEPLSQMGHIFEGNVLNGSLGQPAQ